MSVEAESLFMAARKNVDLTFPNFDRNGVGRSLLWISAGSFAYIGGQTASVMRKTIFMLE
jgi:hypothetical protein